MEKKTIDGREYDVYTEADWERDRTLKVQVGQLIEPSIYFNLLGSVPPKAYLHGVFQPGEPDSWDFDKCCNLFRTFHHVGDNYYKYVGLKP